MNPNLPEISPRDLSARLGSPSRPLLLDVRLEEDFRCSHLPGAVNNCVFEVAFTERLQDQAPDPDAPVCVYGAGGGSRESRMAVEKLLRAGYRDVLLLDGGLDGWVDENLPVEEGPPATPAPAIRDGIHKIDLNESRVRWIGRNLLNMHEGFIRLKSGELRIADGRLTGGEFVIDMKAIVCSDLSGNPLHDVLIRHLLDHDFFDVELYPEARFVITEATPLADASPGSPDLRITGDLTLKDVTAPVTFDACTGVTPDGGPAAQATFSIDRTRWNVLYGSGKWFHHLGGHLVNDHIELQVRLLAEPSVQAD